MPTRFKLLKHFLPPAILFVTLMSVYLRTLAPGLTWAHGGSDGGDLISAAATGGIAHPTGYPLYLLLARAFQLLPVGSLAYRTNLLSALTTALAAIFLYEVVLHAQWNSKDHQKWPAALTAGFAFGLAPLIWSQAVITEVYSLHVLLLAIVVSACSHLIPFQLETQKKYNLNVYKTLILGLAVGNHISTLLMVPGAFLSSAMGDKTQPPRSPLVRYDRSSCLKQLGLFSTGLLLYLLIPLRAMQNPPVNWGNVTTLQRFWWLVSGQLYQSYYLQLNPSALWERAQAATAVLLEQFGLLGVALGLVGLIVYGKPSRLIFLTTWMAVVFAALAVVYGSSDSYLYLMPVLLSFAIWIGTGLIGLSNQISRWPLFGRIVLPFLLLGYLLARSAMQFNQLDASTDLRAESFGNEVLSAAPENAIVFAKGDRAVFALWYFHFALAERPDLAVVAVDLLHFDWYQETLSFTYPWLKVPGPLPWPETVAAMNQSRPVCNIEYSDRAEIDCSKPAQSP